MGASGNCITEIMTIVNHHKIPGWFELEGPLNLLRAMGRDSSPRPACPGCHLLLGNKGSFYHLKG